MKELNETGYMSNRGRINVASFLTRDLEIDWRWGAEYFETQLSKKNKETVFYVFATTNILKLYNE